LRTILILIISSLMVVCICNAIREKDVRSAAREGSSEPRSAYKRLGCQVRCGQCLPFARQIIAAERAIAC
jgi:bacterioferritin-associated ferredoxin